MTLLDNRVSDLCAGYDEICDAHIRLKRKWRDRLLMAYGQKRLTYDAARKEYLNHLHTVRRQVQRGLPVTGGMVILAILLLFLNAWVIKNSLIQLVAFFLIGIGLLAGFGLAMLWVWQMTQHPQPPPHPLHSNLIPPLLPSWKRALQGQLPPVMEYDGAAGEYAFVRQLQQGLNDSHYIIYRLQQKQGDDVDVTVVGPGGVWVFEVKYWSGAIMWQDGQWQRQQTYYESGGTRATKNPVVTQPPDEQWQRMASDVAKSIRVRAPQLVSRFLTGIRAQGGVVFTHEKATYHIASGCPVAWGTPSTWVRQIATAPRIPGWDERVTFTVLDALLTRHHQVVKPAALKSLQAIGKRLVDQAETSLAAWVEEQPQH